MKKKFLWRYILLAVITVVLAAVIGGSLYLIDFTLGNDYGKNMKNASARLEERYPVVKEWCDSMLNTKAMRDTFIVDEDGNRLHALYAGAAEPTRNTAVVIHGYANNSISYMYLGYMFHEKLHFNILMPDLYAHGRSDGSDIQMGLKDADDVMLWTDVANNVFGGNTEMVVHGTSMGAATAMILSGKEDKPFIKCYIEDSGYTSAWDEFEFQLGNMFGLPSFPLMYSSAVLCRMMYGWWFDDANPEEYVAECNKPMLMIHGDEDTFVPFSMFEPLYNAKPAPKEKWIVPNSTHAMAYYDYPEEYTQRVAEFLKKYGFR